LGTGQSLQLEEFNRESGLLPGTPEKNGVIYGKNIFKTDGRRSNGTTREKKEKYRANPTGRADNRLKRHKGRTRPGEKRTGGSFGLMDERGKDCIRGPTGGNYTNWGVKEESF